MYTNYVYVIATGNLESTCRLLSFLHVLLGSIFPYQKLKGLYQIMNRFKPVTFEITLKYYNDENVDFRKKSKRVESVRNHKSIKVTTVYLKRVEMRPIKTIGKSNSIFI